MDLVDIEADAEPVDIDNFANPLVNKKLYRFCKTKDSGIKKMNQVQAITNLFHQKAVALI